MAEKQEKLWTVAFTGKAKKQKDKLPQMVSDILFALRQELEKEGPERVNWPNYGKIKGKTDVYHCHLNKGKPRYVAVWKVVDNVVKLMEIRYVGTHENADYRRIN